MVSAPNESRSPSPPLAAIGFRPFFLLGAALAALLLPAWLLIYRGVIPPVPYTAAAWWHGHEMVFGFACAIIAGFLLTAARNWTGRPTAQGGPLVALVALWAAGRAGPFFAEGLPRFVPMVLDVAFLPLVAVAVGIPIVRSRNWRNLGLVGLLLALGLVNVAYHLGVLGLAPATAVPWALHLAVNLIVLVMVIVGGRIVPSFTRNGLQDPDIENSKALGWVAFGAALLFLAVEATGGLATAAGLLGIAAGAANLLRMRGWGSFRTLKTPMLWVLHAGYAWIGVGLGLKGLGHLGLVMPAVGLHALTAGAIGTLTLGMMTRVSLGHTGRTIVADRWTTLAFALLASGALVRTLGPVLVPAWYAGLMVASGLLWAAAFAIFVARYLPVLSSPRVDGKPG